MTYLKALGIDLQHLTGLDLLLLALAAVSFGALCLHAVTL
jgi:hypothetical protein